MQNDEKEVSTIPTVQIEPFIKNVSLKLNEQIKSIADITVGAYSKITDTMSFTLTEPGWYNGELSVKDYPVTFDDVLYFTFKPVSQIPVITINGNA